MFRGNIEYINSLMRFSYKHIDERSEEHKNEYSKIKDRELDIIGNLKKKIPRNI
jgi:succinate dehydrogenase flavin-adding protein (antitoxin of CptAB toxin-antitoxin module)